MNNEISTISPIRRLVINCGTIPVSFQTKKKGRREVVAARREEGGRSFYGYLYCVLFLIHQSESRRPVIVWLSTRKLLTFNIELWQKLVIASRSTTNPGNFQEHSPQYSCGENGIGTKHGSSQLIQRSCWWIEGHSRPPLGQFSMRYIIMATPSASPAFLLATLPASLNLLCQWPCYSRLAQSQLLLLRGPQCLPALPRPAG